MSTLIFLAFVALILGPIAFFMSLGVRPRLTDLEADSRTRHDSLQDEVAILQRRLRAIEEKLERLAAPAAPSVADVPPKTAAAEPPTEAPSIEPAVTPEPVAEEPPAAAPPAPPPLPALPAVQAPADLTRVSPPIAPDEAPETVEPAVPIEPVSEPRPESLSESWPPAEPPTPPPLPPADGPPPPPQPPRIEGFEPEPEAVPVAPRRSLEETIGTRWTVWIGGLALALGAVLLVRYSIERGFFGPGVRIALGFLLAAVLVGAGEFLRRREPEPGEAEQVANIPAMLTATGTLAVFGTIYASYALYHFIGTAAAFVALGATALACLALAALHGQALAGLGLIGALVTPFLTPSDAPSPWPVVIYIGIVGAAAHALSHIKQWLWLSLAAAAGAGFWAVVLLAPAVPRFFAGAMAHIVWQTALAAAFLGALRLAAVPEEESRLDRPANLVLAGAAILTIGALGFGTLSNTYGWQWLLGAGAVVVILAAIGARIAAVAGALAAAAIVVIAMMTLWPPLILPYGFRGDILAAFFRPDDPKTYRIVGLVGCVAIAALAAARLLRARTLPFWPTACYAGAAALTPLGGLGITYLRFAEGRASLPLAFTAAAAAVGFAAGGSLFYRKLAAEPSSEPVRLGLGALASAAIAAAALALVYALDGGMLTVALALAAAGTAFVAVRLDLTALRWCVAVLGILIGARLAWDPRIVGSALSPTPIFNWLLFGYGVPAASFWLAGWIMRRQRDDTPVRIADALAILFSAFLVFFEIRHAMNGGDPFARGSGLLEQGLLALATFGFGIVLTRLDASRSNVIFRFASLAAGAIGMMLAIVGLGLRWNPLLMPEPVEGGRILNALMLSYLLPGLLAGLLAYFAYRVRPAWYWGGAATIALALCLSYLVLQTRVLFHGQAIWFDRGATLAELGIHTTIFLLAAAAIAWMLATRRWSWTTDPAFDNARTFGLAALLATAALATVTAVLGLGLIQNPLLRSDALAGGIIFNALLPGYLLPALAAAALAYVAAPLGERYWNAAAAAALVLGLAYLLLETRVLFRGTTIVLDRGASLAELGIQTTICVLVATGLVWPLRRITSLFLQQAFLAVAALAAVLFVLGPVFGTNPLLRPMPVAGGLIFNALIPGYLVPALGVALLAFVLRPLHQTFWQIAGAVAAAVCLAYLVLEIRVLFHGTTIVATRGAGIAELGIDTSVFLAIATALMVAARLRQARLLALAGMAMTALALVVGGLGLGIFANPLFSGAVSGGPLINTLLVGYALPAALSLVLAREATRHDGQVVPEVFRVATAIAAIAFLFAFVTLETRRVFHGSVIWFGMATSEAEWYAYSAVWLVLGLVLLAYGLWRRSTTMRLASGLFVLASVAKVFLFDLAGLQGILRAASFIGLGLALIGIGLVYQKLVFARPGGPPPAPPAR